MPVLTVNIMANVVEFLKESYIEMVEKVTWPTWAELQNSAVIVLIASIIIALLVAGMDYSVGNALKLFYKSLA
ncbi:MAG: preprotein translocase, SecE subunit [Daejeonella sp.]|nr:preprotein translocase, SecE subunit [Daejeonella sp.]